MVPRHDRYRKKSIWMYSYDIKSSMLCAGSSCVPRGDDINLSSISYFPITFYITKKKKNLQLHFLLLSGNHRNQCEIIAKKFVTGLSQADLHGNTSHFLEMKDLPIRHTPVTNECLTNRMWREVHGLIVK